MNTNILNEIFDEQAEIFKQSFKVYSAKYFYSPDHSNNLYHSGEYGTYRERVTKDFINLFIPQRLRINSGFVISEKSKPSKQTDIVIYDHNETPLIQTQKGQIFYPIETVASIGEIKSKIDRTTLKTSLNNLVEYKKMREEIYAAFILYTKYPFDIIPNNANEPITKRQPFNPQTRWADQISTFLICEKFNFKLDTNDVHNEINRLYETGVKDRHKIDYILSIEDGFISHFNKNENNFNGATTFSNNEYEIQLAVTTNNNHLKSFATGLNTKLTFTTIVKPEMQKYLKQKND